METSSKELTVFTVDKISSETILCYLFNLRKKSALIPTQSFFKSTRLHKKKKEFIDFFLIKKKKF